MKKHSKAAAFSRPLFFAAALFLAAFSAYSQNARESGNPGGDWVRPGGEAVREEIRYARALAPDLASKLSVITEIQGRARMGGVSPEDKNALRVLRYLAGEGTLSVKRNQYPAAGNFPEARRAACETLGFIGGAAGREILLDVLLTDTEPMVLSEAAAAIGKITPAPDAEILAVFTRLLETKVLAPGGDNNLAMALLAALDKFASPPAGIRDVNLFRVLMRVLDAPLMPEVRRKARLLVEKMKGV